MCDGDDKNNNSNNDDINDDDSKNVFFTVPPTCTNLLNQTKQGANNSICIFCHST